MGPRGAAECACAGPAARSGHAPSSPSPSEPFLSTAAGEKHHGTPRTALLKQQPLAAHWALVMPGKPQFFLSLGVTSHVSGRARGEGPGESWARAPAITVTRTPAGFPPRPGQPPADVAAVHPGLGVQEGDPVPFSSREHVPPQGKCKGPGVCKLRTYPDNLFIHSLISTIIKLIHSINMYLLSTFRGAGVGRVETRQQRRIRGHPAHARLRAGSRGPRN